MLTETCSSILTNKLPKKRKDPSSFTIPCSIKSTLYYLGASVNLMSLSMFKKLKKVKMKPTNITLKLEMVGSTLMA